MEPAGAGAGADRLASLVTSARGWHGVQLAVLAFIGLCGVLSDVDADVPRGLQVTAGLLALLALALACLATFIVARVAWPLTAASTTAGMPAEVAEGARRLRAGVALTFLAVVAMALAASVSWWPTDDGGGATGDGGATGNGGGTVELTDRSGGTACGTLEVAPAGAVRLVTDEGTVDVRIDRLVAITPVDGC
ncbi:MAG TPA: hypothetical protein VF015_13705 [Acidimicrobiales bacterium]